MFHERSLPNDKAKTAVEQTLKRKFGPRDFTWWNVCFDLGKQFKPTILDDYPEDFGLIPNKLIDAWSRYLPIVAWMILTHLFVQMSQGGVLKPFADLDDLVRRIEEGIIKEKSRSLDSPGSVFDREFLIKELCEYNELTYPTDAVSMLEFFQQLGFINVTQRMRQVEYALTAEMASPKEVLKIPKKWEERMNLFLENGSIIFSYLKIDEIVEQA